VPSGSVQSRYSPPRCAQSFRSWNGKSPIAEEDEVRARGGSPWTPSQDAPLAATGATESLEINEEKPEEESLQAATDSADINAATTRRLERMIENIRDTQNRRRVRVELSEHPEPNG
jgi:hypothetical protein